MRLSDAIILVAIAGVFIIYRLLSSARVRHRAKPRRTMTRSQNKAMQLLEEEGYRFVELNPGTGFRTRVDGKYYSDSPDWDFIVKRGITRFAVKVVSRKKNPRLAAREARYAVAGMSLLAGINKVLFVDIERGKIREVELEVGGSSRAKTGWLLGLAFAIGLAGYVLFVHFSGF